MTQLEKIEYEVTSAFIKYIPSCKFKKLSIDQKEQPQDFLYPSPEVIIATILIGYNELKVVFPFLWKILKSFFDYHQVEISVEFYTQNGFKVIEKKQFLSQEKADDFIKNLDHHFDMQNLPKENQKQVLDPQAKKNTVQELAQISGANFWPPDELNYDTEISIKYMDK